ncbi:hypothetical protein F2Q69_00061890 [Brassica cretica]|uniref:Uncharacterized protein n=1 Tax=Brassica cretica TaxID=69181 RepID=A0A8S9RDV0_BRACR|nr:hypothetical protein F2Q69_00061890 [Brassica cretica]
MRSRLCFDWKLSAEGAQPWKGYGMFRRDSSEMPCLVSSEVGKKKGSGDTCPRC